MHRVREIRISLKDYLKDLFESPPLASGLNAYHVYEENQMRAMREGNFSPVHPFIFIIDSNVMPTKQMLPCLILETSFITAPYELGNSRGRMCQSNVHVFGKNRGQRDDLAGFIQDALSGNPDLGAPRALPIYSYTSGSSTLVEIAQVQEGITLIPMPAPGDLGHEGSLNNWNVVTFSYQVRS